jgi:hypothetical protein
LLASLCSALGCSGAIDDDGGLNAPGATAGQPGMSGTGGTGALAGTGGTGAAGTGAAGNNPGACAAVDLPPAREVLLSTRQYMNALRDLLGDDAVSEMDVATGDDLEVELVDRPWVTTAMVDQLLRLADEATESLRGRTADFLGCTGTADRTCVRGAVERIGLRAYKRPLESDELDDVMSVYDDALALVADDDGETAALTALTAILAAPSTLYRTELRGAADADGELSPYERAAALAALLLDSVPDDELMAAAADGSLMSEAGMTAQVDRLLALPRVQDHLTELVMSAYRAPRIFETPKDAMLFPEYNGGLQNSMYEETRRFVEDVLWTRHAPLAELLTSRSTFVNTSLAQLYGVSAPGASADTFAPVTLPDTRAGLLTQASVLSVLSRTDKTSVVARGLFVRGALLCLPKIPAPPAEVQAQVMMQLAANATQQELAGYRAMTSPCMNCHAQFDRFGLVLEAFDPIGRQRSEAVAPIDLTGLPPFSGVVQSPAELAQLIAADGKFVSCMAQRTMAFAITEPFEPVASCAAQPLSDAIAQRGGDMRALITALATQPAFAGRRIEEP